MHHLNIITSHNTGIPKFNVLISHWISTDISRSLTDVHIIADTALPAFNGRPPVNVMSGYFGRKRVLDAIGISIFVLVFGVYLAFTMEVRFMWHVCENGALYKVNLYNVFILWLNKIVFVTHLCVTKTISDSFRIIINKYKFNV